LTSFVTSVDGLISWGGNLGWVAVTASNVVSGLVNYSQLWVNAADFTDPVAKTSYKIGATLLQGWDFQLASRLENDANGNTTTSGAFFVGNYAPRTVVALAGTYSTGSSVGTFTVGAAQIGYYKAQDTVTNGSISCVISSISADQTKFTVPAACAWSATPTIYLAAPAVWSSEISSLIKWVSGAPAADGSNPPY
jgi:hypothetical protein